MRREEAISTLRNYLPALYFGLDTKVVWSTTTTKLDEPERAVRELLA